MGHFVYIRNKKTKPNQPGWWPESKRIEAITAYLSTGSYSITSSITGVPVNTIKTWTQQPWWKEQVEEIQNSEHIELDKKLVRVMDKAMDAVMDRLENGEYMYDEKIGKVVRVPAKLRDTNKVLTDMIDKRDLIKKTKKQEHKPQEVTVDHLLKLAEAFASFSGKPAPKRENSTSIIEGEMIIEELGEDKDNVEQSETFYGVQDKKEQDAS